MARLQLPFETASVPAAREFVRRELAGWSGDRHTVELLTTELATNAILHAHSSFIVSVQIDAGCVHVEVSDASPILPPSPTPPHPEATSGRGLVLVDTLSARWGARRSAKGKYVWFEVLAEPTEESA